MDSRTERPDFAPARQQPRRGASEESIEVRRYIDALRRSKWLIAILVLLTTVTTVVVSKALPKTYTAEASIVKETTTAGPLDTVPVESLTRQLQTIQKLLITSNVLDRAARQVPPDSANALAGTVSSSVDPNANLIYIDATARHPQRAADRANAVATAFVDEQRDVTRQQYARARAGLLNEINAVQTQPDARQQQNALRQRLSELTVSQANAGTDLQVAEAATPPSGPTSPKPVRNGVIAFFL